MLQRVQQLVEVLTLPTFPQLAGNTVRKMCTGSNGVQMVNGTEMPKGWHDGPEDSFHGKICKDGPFPPEKFRYHLIIGAFCPFAHRVDLVRRMYQLEKYAGIDISVVKAYPKEDPGKEGWPGWRFNHKDESYYEGATVEKLYGSRFMHELYFKADKAYKGKYSVPVLWDKKLETIVNNESHELLRDLPTAFSDLLPPELAELSLYPSELRKQIDGMTPWMQDNLNTGVYKAGFAPDQETYDKNLPAVFAALNKLEKIAKRNAGPYILGKQMTEIDIRAYTTIVRFDAVYHQHFKCNLAEIRHGYPVLNNWLKNMYHNHSEIKNSTNFKHIKENYTKSHAGINPKAITPMGPWPTVETGYKDDWSKIEAGGVDMPEVLEAEKKIG